MQEIGWQHCAGTQSSPCMHAVAFPGRGVAGTVVTGGTGVGVVSFGSGAVTHPAHNTRITAGTSNQRKVAGSLMHTYDQDRPILLLRCG
jgi:hypothetical protein